MLDSRDPTVSSARFLSVTTILTILYAWLFVSIYTRTVCDIPVGVYTFAGLVIAGSVGNKLVGKPAPGTSTSTETTTKTTEDTK